MSARKLGRLVGLVFVLALALGGVAIASNVTSHGPGAQHVSAIQMINLELVWG